MIDYIKRHVSKRQWNAIKSSYILVAGLVLGKLYSLLVNRTETSTDFAILFVLMILVLAVVFLFALNLDILGTVEELDSRHRLRIDFVPAVESDSYDIVHEKAKSFLDNSDAKKGCQILAVNSYLEASSTVDSQTGSSDFAGQYYRKIEELVREGAMYSRIVQLPEGLTFSEWVNSTKRHYKNHFNEIIKMQSAARQAVLLMSSKARFPLSFLLIKNKNGTNYLIWQIDEQATGSASGLPQFQLHGIFLVEDPDRKIVDHFDWCFNQLLHTNTRIEPSEFTYPDQNL